jgi:hypothetical protein
MSNKEFRTAEVLERDKKKLFTSIFCGSAVHILKHLVADSFIQLSQSPFFSGAEKEDLSRASAPASSDIHLR